MKKPNSLIQRKILVKDDDCVSSVVFSIIFNMMQMEEVVFERTKGVMVHMQHIIQAKTETGMEYSNPIASWYPNVEMLFPDKPTAFPELPDLESMPDKIKLFEEEVLVRELVSLRMTIKAQEIIDGYGYTAKTKPQK